MNEIIQIKCPFCGSMLSVSNQTGIETKNVTCPICKKKNPFSAFKRVDHMTTKESHKSGYQEVEDHTSYAYENGSNEHTSFGDLNFVIGKVKIVSSGLSYQLRPGKNVIGRKGQKSTADFQIEMGEKRAMSREHIVIDVKKVIGKGFVHYISLFKEKVNDTYIGEEKLLYGDTVILSHGDVIRLPDANLKFEISDDEATDI